MTALVSEPETIEVDAFDQRTPVLRGGTGPDLLFLHGEAATSGWSPIHDALARLYTVYAPLHPGFGGQAVPDWMHDITDVSFHYRDLVASLDLVDPLLVGVSIGGWMAIDLAIHDSAPFRAVVAIGPLGLKPNEAMPDLFIMQAHDALTYLANDIDTTGADPMEGDADTATRLWCDLAAQARLMWERTYDPRLERRAHHMRCPTMVIWGGSDRLLRVEHGNRYADLLGARLEVVQHAGHMVSIDDPGAVTELIAAFDTEIGASHDRTGTAR